MEKLVTSIVVTLAAVAFATAAEIRNVTAKQRYPWNGKVDVTYEIVGDLTAGVATWNRPYLCVTATNRTDGTCYVATTNVLSGDTGMADGLHHVVWNMSAQGLDFKSDDMVFTVTYEEHPRLYCVIDLSLRSVYWADVPPPGGFNSREYKTSKLALRLIEPGTFMMCGKYKVTLTKPFYIGIFEVTLDQYERVTGCNPNPDYNSYGVLPVTCVSWNMIRINASSPYNSPSSGNTTPFIEKIKTWTGLDFDLPTEAQWEYACRAGTTSLYNNGGDSEDDLKQLGRYGSTDYNQTPSMVGCYKPNGWGLYDMHGNVWEWCLDWYGELSNDLFDPIGPSSGSKRVARGGSWWQDYASKCTSAYRYSAYSDALNINFGFRIARTLSNQ